MTSDDEPADLSDAEKHKIRQGLTRRLGALMKAWQLGMFQARDEAQRALLEELRGEVGLLVVPEHPEAIPLGLRRRPPKPSAEALTRLTDDDYLEIFDEMAHRYVGLHDAYDAGMVVAETPRQEAQMEELRELLGPPG